jgi:16S rRNA (guanine966-N2)-methyltransferase
VSGASRTRGEVRIIGGTLRRRRLRVAAVEGVRPSPDRVRETLFNWLGQDLEGWTVLDLFAGSGALGFEAASRGAARVVMIERHPAVLEVLRENRDALGLASVEIVAADARTWPAGTRERFDLITADPPFQDVRAAELLGRLSTCLKPSGMVYLETPIEVVPGRGWRVFRSARAGQVHYQLLLPHDPQAEDLVGGSESGS